MGVGVKLSLTLMAGTGYGEGVATKGGGLRSPSQNFFDQEMAYFGGF